MDLEKLQTMWVKDSVIDDTLLDEASLKIPQLHSKYLSIYNDTRLLIIKSTQELKLIKHKQNLYYSGKDTPEDSEPFNYKVMKSDIPNWVSVDERVMKVEAKLEYYEVILHSLSEILKQIQNRNYLIKNAIEWRRFTSGG